MIAAQAVLCVVMPDACGLGGDMLALVHVPGHAPLAINGPDDTSTGRWIPTTSVDQYFATLAKWFGVDQSNLPVVFPNLNRFSPTDLQFMS